MIYDVQEPTQKYFRNLILVKEEEKEKKKEKEQHTCGGFNTYSSISAIYISKSSKNCTRLLG